jgi:hypothetical protein
MTDSHDSRARPLDDDDLRDFTPVPLDRHRRDGWTPWAQRSFVRALAAMGAVGPAARAVGMSRASAYKLRGRPGATGFAAAWDRALADGRARIFDVAMDRAINGVTTVTVRRGGSIDVTGGPDMTLVRAALREAPGP